MTKTRTLVRQLIEDIAEDINDYATYETATLAGRTFPLSEENPISTTIDVYINEVETAESNYTFDSSTGSIVVKDAVMSLTDELRVHYDAYRKYSTNEIDAYINRAFVWLSTLKVNDWDVNSSNVIVPQPSVSERRLIALIASILVNGNLLSYKTKEFGMNFNKDITPEQKIRKLVAGFNSTLGKFSWISYDGEDT